MTGSEMGEVPGLRHGAGHEQLNDLARFADGTPACLCIYARPIHAVSGTLGFITYASPSMVGVLGLQAEEAMEDAARLFDQIHPDDRPLVAAALSRIESPGRPCGVQFRIAHPQKGERWLDSHWTCMQDGELAICHGFIHDITEHKRQEIQQYGNELRYQDIFNNTSDHIFILDLTEDKRLRITAINSAFEKAQGLPRETIIGKYIEEFIPDVKTEVLYAHYWQCVESGMGCEYEAEVELKTGRYIFRTTLIPIHDASGRVYRIATIAHDITQHKALEEVLNKRAAEMSALVENTPDNIIRYDTNTRISYMNPALAHTLGILAEQVIGKQASEFFANTPVLKEYHKVLETVIATGQATEFELAYAPNRYDQIRIVPEISSDGQVMGVIAIGRDMTRQKQLEEELRRREADFRELVENSPDSIGRYDLNCRRLYANPKLISLLGGDSSIILGKTPMEHPGGAWSMEYEKLLRMVIADGKEHECELRRQDGERTSCGLIRMRPEFNQAGEFVSVLAVGRDITELDQYRQKVHRQAFYDPLTGLPNRALLIDRIGMAITAAKRYGRQFGLMLLDLDHFKEVNDVLGHSAGDCLLRETAQRLQRCIRKSDTIARLGGDEFALLALEVTGSEDLVAIAAKILRVMAEPIIIDDRELFISCSIGITLCPDDSDDMDGLMQYADSAMYHAKKQGRNNFQFYARELTARTSERLELVAALRHALKNGEFELYYQPQIDMQTQRVTGAEALLRWHRPEHGFVLPVKFIPIAEESGLIVEIGEWVLATACEAAVAWNQSCTTPLVVAVNLSTRQFLRNDLAGSVRRIVSETGCQPHWLKLEITESLLLEDSREVAATLEELHAMGLSISIDDFGTGYSALSYLNQFPVSQLKIDRSFVRDIPTNKDKCELVKAMLSISAALRLETVAEGVETLEQAGYLMACGCRLAQGYLYGAPMPHAAFDNMLKQP